MYFVTDFRKHVCFYMETFTLLDIFIRKLDLLILIFMKKVLTYLKENEKNNACWFIAIDARWVLVYSCFCIRD